jgi:dihydroorotate dehydrogenase electron transfer subunit
LRTGLRIVEVKRVVKETPSTKTLFFDSDFDARPAQFVMVWNPGVDEIPMTISYLGEEKGITVKDIGEATNALISLKEGAKLGIRGPFGNSFDLRPGRILAVGGGSGIVTVTPAVEFASKEGYSVDVCIGATAKDELLFRRRLEKVAEVQVSTDDGSEGYKGFVTGLVEEILGDKEYDQMICCGPEPMMKKLLDMAMAKRLHFQASLERYMKCALGICDSCAFGPYLVCKDGPVFDGDRLINVDDFGRFRRTSSGEKVKL